MTGHQTTNQFDLVEQAHSLIATIEDMIPELDRLCRIEQCARYLVNSNAWVGYTEGIEANIAKLQEILNVRP